MLLRTGVCWAIALAALVFFTYVDALVSLLFFLNSQKISSNPWTMKLVENS